jgi:hypothetical protein
VDGIVEKRWVYLILSPNCSNQKRIEMKDKILDYLNGELSQTERVDFENALAKDPILQQEFEFHKNKWIQLKTAHLQKIAQAKTKIWTAGAEKLRRQQRILRLTIAMTAVTTCVGVKFAYNKWQNKHKMNIIEPLRRTPENQVRIDSIESQLKVEKYQANTPTIENAQPLNLPTSPTSISKNKVKIVPAQEAVVATSPNITESVVIPPFIMQGDGLKAGANGIDTVKHKQIPAKIKMSSLDSILRIPIKSLVSKTDLIKRFEKVLQPKNNNNIVKIINLYYDSNESDENISFENEDSPTQADMAALWLLKTFYNWEITQDRSAIFNCLIQIPSGFFITEKALYEKIFEFEQYKTVLIPLIEEMQQDVMNIHAEKAAKIAAILN